MCFEVPAYSGWFPGSALQPAVTQSLPKPPHIDHALTDTDWDQAPKNEVEGFLNSGLSKAWVSEGAALGFSQFVLEGHLPPAVAACVKKPAGNKRHLSPQRRSCQAATLSPWLYPGSTWPAREQVPEEGNIWRLAAWHWKPLEINPTGDRRAKVELQSSELFVPTWPDSTQHVGVRQLCGTWQRPAEISLPGNLTSPGHVSRPITVAAHPWTVMVRLSGNKHSSLSLAAHVCGGWLYHQGPSEVPMSFLPGSSQHYSSCTAPREAPSADHWETRQQHWCPASQIQGFCLPSASTCAKASHWGK